MSFCGSARRYCVGLQLGRRREATQKIVSHLISRTPMSPAARHFLNYEFATLSLMAGLATRNPKAPIYRDGASEDNRLSLKNWLREELTRLGGRYRVVEVSEIDHVDNIANFAAAASRSNGGVLLNGQMRFGVAQKLVNLYLKYLWVSNDICMPPHCPIDGRIAQMAGLPYQWTSSHSRPEYEAAILALKTRISSSNESIADWELRMFEVGRQAAARNST